MGKKQITEIDKLFLSKLGKDAISPAAWNEPTDDMVLAAMVQVNKPAKKSVSRKRLLFWPLLLIPFLGLLGFSISNALQVGELKSAINEMQSNEFAVAALPETTSSNEQTTVENDLVIESEIAKIDNRNENEISSTNNKPVKAKSTNSRATNNKGAINNTTPNLNRVNNVVPPTNNNFTPGMRNGGSAENIAFPILSNKEVLENTTPHTQASLEIRTPVEEVIGFNQLPPKNGLLNILERNAISLSLETTPYEKEEVEVNNSKFALYGFMNINSNFLRVSGLETNSYSLTDYDLSYRGYEYGVGALQNINKRFSIAYSLSHNEVVNHSLFESECIFNESNMVVGANGETSYLLDTNVATPLGDFSLRQSVPMEDVQIQDQSMMNQTTQIRQSLKFLSFGVQPRVNLWSNDNLSLFAEGGLNVNYLVSFDQNLELEMQHNGHTMMQKEMYDDSMTSLNRLTVGATAGLGLNYSFGDHLFSSIRLGGSRSLNPISQQTNAGGEVDSYIDNLSLSISAGYKF